MSDEKKTVCARAHMGESLYAALSQLADMEDRTVSEYISLVLARHVYGHATKLEAASHGNRRDGQGQSDGSSGHSES